MRMASGSPAGPYTSGFSRGEVLASKTKILVSECDLVNVRKLIAERDNWRETADRFREAIDADEAILLYAELAKEYEEPKEKMNSAAFSAKIQGILSNVQGSLCCWKQ